VNREGYTEAVSAPEHRRDAPSSVRCMVITISDTRTEASDTSGDAIAQLLSGAGHTIVQRSRVRDEPALVRDAVRSANGRADVVVTTGGTGITARDSTYEAIVSLLDKRLDGFGELFRMLSYEEIGAAAMMSRAVAGTMGGVAIFALPGSENAVRLALAKLIVPEIAHVVRELRRS
jgi:molybdopterin adenylyltransferase